jgi:DNA-binding transcriptional LysR family regulator
MIDLNDIVVFAQVAREQSFTRAAKSLGLPKSTVSERVARLESALGVRLLERTTRSLRLTASGDAYFARVSSIVQALEEAESAVTAAQKVPKGKLRVGSPVLFAHVFLADVVSAYLTRFPGVQVEMVLADRTFDLVEEGLDVVIHVLGPMDAQLVARKLGEGSRTCVASPAYLASRKAPETPLDLAEHDCLVSGASCHVSWSFERDATADATPPSPMKSHTIALRARYAVSSMDLVHRAALADHGIAILPTFLCARDLKAKRLVKVLEGWSPADVAVHLVYPSRRHLPARVRAFVDLVIERSPTFPTEASAGLCDTRPPK